METNKDLLLLQAIKEVCPKVEKITWDVIASPSHARVFFDARTRAVAVYRELSSVQSEAAIGNLVNRNRTTLIHIRQQHETLMKTDWVYRRRYGVILKEVGDRYSFLKEQYYINHKPKEQETMFTSTISGNLGRDAEIVTLRDRNYYKLNLAIKGKSREDAATWVQILYYKTDGSKLGDLLLSGAGVVAQGRLEVKPYIKRDGGAGVDITLWADTLEVTKFPEQKPEVAAETIEDIPEDGDIF